MFMYMPLNKEDEKKRELQSMIAREHRRIQELENDARYHAARAKACWDEAAQIRAALV